MYEFAVSLVIVLAALVAPFVFFYWASYRKRGLYYVNEDDVSDMVEEIMRDLPPFISKVDEESKSVSFVKYKREED